MALKLCLVCPFTLTGPIRWPSTCAAWRPAWPPAAIWSRCSHPAPPATRCGPGGGACGRWRRVTASAVTAPDESRWSWPSPRRCRCDSTAGGAAPACRWRPAPTSRWLCARAVRPRPRPRAAAARRGHRSAQALPGPDRRHVPLHGRARPHLPRADVGPRALPARASTRCWPPAPRPRRWPPSLSRRLLADPRRHLRPVPPVYQARTPYRRRVDAREPPRGEGAR